MIFKRIYKSIVVKLWIAIVVLFIVVLSVLGVFLSQSFAKYYMNLQESDLNRKALNVAKIIQEEKDEKLAMEKINLLLADSNAHARIANLQGLIQKCSPDMPANVGMRLDSQDVAKLNKGQTVLHNGDNQMGVKMISVTVPIKINGQVELAVQVMSPLEPITETTNQVKELIIAAALGAILLATILSFFLSRKISKPLLDMNLVANQMRQKNFDGKVNVIHDDELGRLGNTLNILSEELRETLDALSNEKDQLNNVLSSMTDGVITFSHLGQIIMMNPQANKLFNFTNKMPIGQKIEDCCPIPEMKALFNEVLASMQAQTRQVKWQKQVLAIKMAPLKDEQKQVRGVVAVVQDVTKENKLEKMRKDFVANVSHELRNPLFLLQGYSEALLHNVTENKDEQDEIIKIIVDETLRLQRLVNDILDLANLESDKLSLNKQTISIQEIIAGIIRRYKPVATERNIDLKTNIPDDFPDIYLDPDKITQVLINLMDNALRFSGEKGQILINTGLSENSLTISVVDNGQGIPEEELPFIWERFYKVEKSRNRKLGGTGLGLAIVKKIVEAHGGNVNIQSKYGSGTTVTIQIPV